MDKKYSRNKGISNARYYSIVLSVVVVIFSIVVISNTIDFSEKNNSAQPHVHETKQCNRCATDLTNRTDRIYVNGSYYCLSCWKQTKKEIEY